MDLDLKVFPSCLADLQGVSMDDVNAHSDALASLYRLEKSQVIDMSVRAHVSSVMSFIERRVPVRDTTDSGRLPGPAVLRKDAMSAIANLACSRFRFIDPEATRELLVAYGRANYFDVEDTRMPIGTLSQGASPIHSAIMYSSMPASLAFIDLGARLYHPTKSDSYSLSDDIPGFFEFVGGFILPRSGNHSLIEAAVHERVMRERISGRAEELREAVAGSAWPSDQAPSPSSAATPARTRRMGV